ncbi:MAG: hypothetical protein FJ100_15790 [Deltaproteobacteria bacterium]|nr:hypothetical protein [Deltaproteobacteria bacterium]
MHAHGPIRWVAAGSLAIALACSAPVERGFGSACANGAECASGVCAQGACSKPCTTSATCAGHLCVAGLCTPSDKVPCNGDDVCEERVLPSGPCQVARCQQHLCRLVPRPESTPCGDSLCEVPKACVLGVCSATPGAATPVCDDGNTCTHDGCSPQIGCTAVPNALPCDDGKFCTAGEACAAGACKGGKPVACGDGSACAIALCSESAKGCTTTKPSGGPCEDGDPCTAGDTCKDGVCLAGKAAACDDGKPCTADKCSPGGQCSSVAVADGTGCQDGDACTTSDLCQAGGCVAGAAMACNDDKPCTQDACQAGKCAFVDAGPGALCDDGDPCTGWGVCQAGTCGKGELGVWSQVQPVVPNTPTTAVAVDVRGGVVYLTGSESSAGKFEVARYVVTTGGVALAGENFSDAGYGLAAADATWMPQPGTAGAHVAVGAASKAGAAIAGFAVLFPLDGKVAPKMAVVADTFAAVAKPLRWTAVDAELPHIWVAGEYGAPDPTKPYIGRLTADLGLAMQTVLEETTQGGDVIETHDIAVDPAGAGAIVVGRISNGFGQSGYVRRVHLNLQPDWKAPTAADAAWYAIEPSGGSWIVAGARLKPNGLSAIAVAELLADGTWGWQQEHTVGQHATALALAVAPAGTALYVAGWTIPEPGKLAAPLVGRLTPLGALVEFSVLGTDDKATLQAVALNEAATQVVAVGVHGPNEFNSGAMVVAGNAFAQLACLDAGACTGQPAAACNDGKPCTFDSCTKGKCSHLPMPDDAPCAAAAVCKTGVCGF